ncbi:MAG: rhomboid family intramembrane serine protease [Halioglobus sp.]
MTTNHSWRSALASAAALVGIMWLLHLASWISGLELQAMGVLPREISGLSGILTAPLIHGSWQHLMSNTPPLLILGALIFYGYPRSAAPALVGIWLVSGLGVWLLARSSYHLGASGLTHGMFFFLFVSGMLRRDRKSAVLLLLAFYLYGGMVMTIFPGDPSISFESHFFGALAGGLMAMLLRHRDPPPPRRRYSWEIEEDEIPDSDHEADR